MIRSLFRMLLPLLIMVLLSSCSSDKKVSADRSAGRGTVVIGIGSDVDTFNPVFAQDVTSGEIAELVYPSLVRADFDTVRGTLAYSPMLARSWESLNNGRDLLFHIRSEARWSDGTPVTARDVQFSYELYGSEVLGSVRQNEVKGLKKAADGKINFKQSVEIVNDSTVRFKFERSGPSQLHDTGMPIVPAHILDTIPHNELRTHPINKSPLGAGPFSLKSWKPGQDIELQSNSSSVLPNPARLEQLVFRVIPDHGARFSQLKSGEIDIMTDLNTDEARQLEGENSPVRVVTTPPRRYQFIGWNNIDGDAFASSSNKTIRPHRLFGNKHTRTAMTMAIDRKSIITAMLGEFAQEAIGPVSPVFRSAYNDSLKPLPYDPAAARAILKQEGWSDRDGDGVLEKNGIPFSFVLTVPSGSQFSGELANIIQKQLRDIKVDVKIEQVEESVFWQQMIGKKYDAFVGGFEVSLDLQLSVFWGSDLTLYPFNLMSFRNQRADRILHAIDAEGTDRTTSPLWKEFQEIIADEQPCTFLFWEKNVIGVNKRVQGTNFTILGTTYRAWTWETD